MSIDVTALAGIVRRLDRSATLKAFVAVLAPLFVLGNLAVIFGGVLSFLELDLDFSDESAAFVAVIAVMVLTAFAPLGFVVLDWAARKQSWRHVSAISGAVLGAIGFAALGGFLGFLALEYTDADTGLLGATPHRDVAVLGAVAMIGLATWLVARAKLLRAILLAAAGGVLLLVIAGLVALLRAVAEDAQSDPAAGRGDVAAMLGMLVLIGLAIRWLIRFVRLRIVLSADRPRSLLFGASHQSGLWRHLAFLTGLPSSLWDRSALRTSAFWVFMIARPLVYVGFAFLVSDVYARFGVATTIVIGSGFIVAGHCAFFAGKRLAARRIWAPRNPHDTRAPILFLRSFDDDQFDFQRPVWDLVGRWFDLWSFRRNADEALIDEIAQYGPVVALGRPGEETAPFGAQRHYSTHGDWQATITETARRAQAIVIVAGDSPGVLWEYDLLRRERLLDRTLLLFRPAMSAAETNRRALDAFQSRLESKTSLEMPQEGSPVALLQTPDRPVLLTARPARAAAYVVAMRAHLQKSAAGHLVDPAL